ncbi:MAG: DUF3795 domain-containing protein [Spirochaetes bacterium]|nr:DUF3795 domain-containing protein [Spirochaetota bacterium]
MDKSLATCCGNDCTECQYYRERCEGCVFRKGRPFWVNYAAGEVCTLYRCCMEQKRLAHCGLCVQFPCETFMNMEQSNPDMSPDQAKESAKKRRLALLQRT